MTSPYLSVKDSLLGRECVTMFLLIISCLVIGVGMTEDEVPFKGIQVSFVAFTFLSTRDQFIEKEDLGKTLKKICFHIFLIG